MEGLIVDGKVLAWNGGGAVRQVRAQRALKEQRCWGQMSEATWEPAKDGTGRADTSEKGPGL